MNLNMLNIPVHKNCTNCGKCCGIIPATSEEVEAIRSYIAENDIKPVRSYTSTCPFRDEAQKKCLIYPVRPLICRLFGVAKKAECPNGNSADIDGSKFFNFGNRSIDDIEILNFVNWFIDWRKEK